jgi:hypothetical protein
MAATKANWIVSAEKGIEIAAEDVLHFFVNTGKEIVLRGPAVLSGLALLCVKIEPLVADAMTDASNPAEMLNVSFTVQEIKDIQAIIPAFKQELAAAGVKF